VLILDTHVLVWLDSASTRLGERARKQIDKALREESLYISAITFWEAAMLAEKRRLTMNMEVLDWRASLLEKGLKELSLSGEIAILSAGLADFHGDPADRMIVASALRHTATLCSADEKILAWSHRLKRIDARA